MAERLRVALLFGGRSAEHEVSVLSAANVFRALDPARYETVPIGITGPGLGSSHPFTTAHSPPPYPKEGNARRARSRRLRAARRHARE